MAAALFEDRCMTFTAFCNWGHLFYLLFHFMLFLNVYLILRFSELILMLYLSSFLDLLLNIQDPSIYFPYPLVLCKVGGVQSLPKKLRAQGRKSPRTGCQPIVGHTHTPFSPTDNLPVHFSVLWECGGKTPPYKIQ